MAWMRGVDTSSRAFDGGGRSADFGGSPRDPDRKGFLVLLALPRRIGRHNRIRDAGGVKTDRKRGVVGESVFGGACMKKLFYCPLVGLALWVLSHACPVLAAEGKKLEVFSWWASGSEAAALRALYKVYKQKNPGVEVLNAAITGGGPSRAADPSGGGQPARHLADPPG
jgi:hypothetical protein